MHPLRIGTQAVVKCVGYYTIFGEPMVSLDKATAIRKFREIERRLNEGAGGAAATWNSLLNKPDKFPAEEHEHPQYLVENDPRLPSPQAGAESNILFVSDLSEVPDGTPADTLIIVRAINEAPEEPMPVTPFVVGTPTTGFSTTGTTLRVPTPASDVQEGDVLIALLRSQMDSSASDFTATGWSRISPTHSPTDGGRVLGLHASVVTNPTTLPTETLFTLTGNTGRTTGAMFVVRGANADNLVAGRAPNNRGTLVDGVRTVASFVTDTPALILAVAGAETVDGTSKVPATIPAGFTEVVSAQTGGGTSTSGSRTSIWVGSKVQLTSPTAPAGFTWGGGVGGDAVHAVALRGI